MRKQIAISVLMIAAVLICLPRVALSSGGHNPPIGQQFAPDKTLRFLKLPTTLDIPNVVGGRPTMLQGAKNVTSIMAWAEGVYPYPWIHSIDDDIVVVLGSTYSGVNAWDVFVFVRSYKANRYPWKLVYAKLQAVTLTIDSVETEYLDQSGREVVLATRAGKVLLRADIGKARKVLQPSVGIAP